MLLYLSFQGQPGQVAAQKNIEKIPLTGKGPVRSVSSYAFPKSAKSTQLPRRKKDHDEEAEAEENKRTPFSSVGGPPPPPECFPGAPDCSGWMGPFSLLFFLWSPLPLATEEEEATALGMRGGGQSPLFPSFLPSSFPLGSSTLVGQRGKGFSLPPSALACHSEFADQSDRAASDLPEEERGKKRCCRSPFSFRPNPDRGGEKCAILLQPTLDYKGELRLFRIGSVEEVSSVAVFFCGGAKRGPFVGLFALLSARGGAPIQPLHAHRPAHLFRRHNEEAWRALDARAALPERGAREPCLQSAGGGGGDGGGRQRERGHHGGAGDGASAGAGAGPKHRH